MRALLAVVLLACLAVPAFAFEERTPLLSVERVYPFVGVSQQWRLIPGVFDESDIILKAGVGYSLGVIAPQFIWRWDPEPGGDWHEIEIGVNVNLRGLIR